MCGKSGTSDHMFTPSHFPASTKIKDVSTNEKLPISQIPNIEDDALRRISSSSTTSSRMNIDVIPSKDTTDFIEFEYSKPKYNQTETIKEISHNFNNLEPNSPQTKHNGGELKPTADRELIPTRKIKPKEFDIDDSSDEDDEWKEMETQLNYGDIYNLKGEKIEFAHSKDDITYENSVQQQKEHKKKKKSTLQKVMNLGKSEKEEQLKEKYRRAHLMNSDTSNQGYTKIDEEKQAKKFEEMDKRFDFLFQNENNNLRKLHNASSAELITTDLFKATDGFVSNDKFDEIFQQEGHDDNELNPEMQMMSTKSMLNDSQKIAYAALVKLVIVQLNTSLVSIRGSNSTKILKKLAKCHTSFMRWSINIMNAIYKHLDIQNDQEINMNETLSCHGVESSDLSKTFNKNIQIENHLNKENLHIINLNGAELECEKSLDIDIKWTLICDLFLILLEASVYDARSRTLLIHFAEAIGITEVEILQFERRITDSLEIDEAFEIINNNQTWDESDILKEHKRKAKNKRIVKIALATAAGGLVIGLSAGALAPVIGAGLAAGLTTIGISGTGGFLAGAGGTAIITTAGTMTGMNAGKTAMQHRVGSVKTFEFIPLHNNRRVNLIITVSGWMSGTMDDIRLPFSTVDQVMGDLYSLLWEPEMLTSMGQTINILANEILTQSIQQILGATLLITLMSGLQLPMMLSKLGYLLDNPWNNSLDRAWRSGKVLADTLRRKKLGMRPITLVGFSLGARLIYSCLLDLAKSGDYGIIENVYLFGSPIVIHEDEMAQVRSVVSGRFVNGYMKQDWILGYLFRATSGGLRRIAGLSPVDGEKFNVENMDCSEHVKGHMQYREAMPKLLRDIGWEVLEDQFVEIEQPNPEEEERQRKLLSEIEKRQHSKKKKTWYNKLWRKKNKEWWEMYEEGEKERESRNKKDNDNDATADTSKPERKTDENEIFSASVDLDALKQEVLKIELEAKKLEEKNTKKNPKTGKANTDQNTPELNSTLQPHSTPNSISNLEVEEPNTIEKQQDIIQLTQSPEKQEKSDIAGLKPFKIRSATHVHKGGASVGVDVVEELHDEYGEYDVPKTEEKLEIMFDDDIKNLEEKIRLQQKDHPGYGVNTGIDYGDEDEFPEDEGNIQFTIQ